MSFRLAAGLAIVAIVAAAAAAAVAIHNSTGSTAPAAPRMSVGDYQNLIHSVAADPSIWADPCDDSHFQGCGSDAARSIPVIQKWLDATKLSNPPARFAAVNAEMRQQLAQNIDALKSLLADSQRGDDAAMTRDYDIAVYAVYWTSQAVPAIAGSHQVSATAYKQMIVTEKDAFDSCSGCQLLFNLKAGACVDTGGNTCITVFDDVAPHFDLFEAALVLKSAPQSLAGQDTKLQGDLERANSILLKLRVAAANNDAAGLNSLAPQLQAIKAQIDQDAGKIAG